MSTRMAWPYSPDVTRRWLGERKDRKAPPVWMTVLDARVVADECFFESVADWCGGRVVTGEYGVLFIEVYGRVASESDVILKDEREWFRVMDRDEFYKTHVLVVGPQGVFARVKAEGVFPDA